MTPNHHALAEVCAAGQLLLQRVLSADRAQWWPRVCDGLYRKHSAGSRNYPYAGDDALAIVVRFIWDQVLARTDVRNYGETGQITPKDATWAQIYAQYQNSGDAIQIEATFRRSGNESRFIGFRGGAGCVPGEGVSGGVLGSRMGLPHFAAMLL